MISKIIIVPDKIAKMNINEFNAIKFPYMQKIFLVIIFFVQLTFAIRSSITVYPLVNHSGESLHNWIAYSVPEIFSRKLSAIEGIRVWDPVFMYQTDSLGWRMTSDSILRVHCSRWMWDAAIGGKFTIENDSVRIDLKIIWVADTKQHVTIKISRKTKITKLFTLCNELLLNTCTLLRIPLTEDDSMKIVSDEHIEAAAARTFCAGYGFEMTGLYSEAQTAYNQAISIDPAFIMPRCRSGALYVRTGNMPEARNVFKNIIHSKYHTNLTIAMTADFAVDQFKHSRSLKLIESYRVQLEKSASGLMSMGKWYLTTGEYQRAIALFRRAIAWGPSDLNAEFLLAMAYMWSGEYTSAIEIFNRLITMRPEYIRYQVSLGAVYRKAGRYMESLAVLESARKKEPENAMVLIELAHTSFALTWYRKAGQLLELALRLKPDQHEILIDLGIVYWHEKRYSDSRRCFNLAEKAGKGKQVMAVNYGNIYLMDGNAGKAIASYRKADRSGGRNPEVLYNLAIAHLKRGDKKAAARYLDELIQLTPGRIDLLVIRAHLAQMLGKNEDAKMAYHKILENDPYLDPAVEGLVKLLIGEKKYEEAIYQIESYLEAKPARGDFMVLLGDAYLAREWYEVAMVKYEQVVRSFPDYFAGYLGVGRCMYQMIRNRNYKKYDAALYALKQAGSKAPKNPEPDDLMGDIYFYYKGYSEQAVELWRSAAAKTTDIQQKKKILKKIKSAGKH